MKSSARANPHLAWSLLVVVIGAAMFQLGRLGQAPKDAQRPVTRPAELVLEAEAVSAVMAPFTTQVVNGAGGGSVLSVADNTFARDAERPVLTLPFSTVTDAAWHLWALVRWQDGCGNSIDIGVDEQPLLTIGQDGTYNVWHWIRGPNLSLAAGVHQLRLAAREDGVAVDQFLLTTDADLYPEGAFAPAALTAESPPPPALAAATPAPAGEAAKAVVVGMYHGGFESMLVRLGVPTRRLQLADLLAPEALAAVDLVCFSGDDPWTPQLLEVLNDYVSNGGVLIVEAYSSYVAHSDLPLADLIRRATLFRLNGCTIVNDGSFLFADERASEIRLDRRVTSNYLLPGSNGPATEYFGSLRYRGYTIGAALQRTAIGRGRLYVAGSPLGFASMWRGPSVDTLLQNLIRDALREYATPVFANVDWQADAATTVFSDDFMRETINDDVWRATATIFTMTGSTPPSGANAFSLHGDGDGVLRAGAPGWADYRLSAALLLKSGSAGLEMATDETPVRAVVATDRLQLRQGDRVLADMPVTLTRDWHRLSLMQRERHWELWLDGQVQAVVPAKSNVRGQFGLVCGGQALFDDVWVQPTAAVIPGCDRAYGEEGSSYARPTVTRDSAEARGISSPAWLLTGGAPQHLEFRLPLYQAARLSAGTAALPLAAGSVSVAMPPLAPGSRISLRTCGWRDFAFGGRVTDWVAAGNSWEPLPRWSCDAKWSWLGVATEPTAILWYRHALRPPYAINVLMSVASGDDWQDYRPVEDLNLVVAGNGHDLTDALAFHIGGSGVGSQLLRNETVLAENRAGTLPSQKYLHHIWTEVRAVAEPQRLQCFIDGRQVLDYSGEIPVGQVGIWTRSNEIRVARATLSVSADAAAN